MSNLILLITYVVIILGCVQWYKKFKYPENKTDEEMSLILLVCSILFGTLFYFIAFSSNICYLPTCIFALLSVTQLSWEIFYKNYKEIALEFVRKKLDINKEDKNDNSK